MADRLTTRKVLPGAAIVVAVVIAATLVAVSAIGSRDKGSSAAINGSAETAAMLRGIPQHGNVLGSPKAPVTLYEYADLQCPYCARFALETLPTIVQDYVRTGKVKLVFRGVAILGPDSTPPLETAYAAGQQNRLWNYTELVFHNQGQENAGWVTNDVLHAIGKAVPGLDTDKAMGDRTSASVQAAISDAQAGWVNDGLRYTPSFVIVRKGGGRTVLEGALPAGDFERAIDKLLNA